VGQEFVKENSEDDGGFYSSHRIAFVEKSGRNKELGIV